MAGNKARPLIIVAVVMLFAGLLAWAAGQGGVRVSGVPLFLVCTLLAFLVQWLAFIPAFKYQTERYYDLCGSCTYVLLVATALTYIEQLDFRTLLLSSLVVIWALRLGLFLFRRIIQDGADRRFNEIKPNFFRFLVAWTLQGLWIVVTLSSALAAITSEVKKPIDVAAIIGLVVWLSGFTFEVIADYQKRVFRQSQQGEKGFIHTGLWAYSRHPNYFGEIVLWTGISIIAFPVLSGWQYVTLISPVFVTLLLVRISGIPMLEASADKRWQGNAQYEAYKKSTPVLVPRFFATRAIKES